jgi:hypothetical protein
MCIFASGEGKSPEPRCGGAPGAAIAADSIAERGLPINLILSCIRVGSCATSPAPATVCGNADFGGTHPFRNVREKDRAPGDRENGGFSAQ